MDETPPYKLRGNRVKPMNYEEINRYAALTGSYLGLRTRRKQFDRAFERLQQLDIQLDIVDDEAWLHLSDGYYDPSTKMITVQNGTYMKACDGDVEALFIMMHEIGHAILGHKAVLHHSTDAASKEEDAEWQADTFAELLFKHLNICKAIQLELFDTKKKA